MGQNLWSYGLHLGQKVLKRTTSDPQHRDLIHYSYILAGFMINSSTNRVQ